MRAVIQRTKHSRVLVNGTVKSAIGEGLVVLLGVKRGDNLNDG